MKMIAQYSEPVQTVLAVCDHPNQIVALQKQITELQMKAFLPPTCDHTVFEQLIQQLRGDLDEARKTPRTVATDEELRRVLDDMTRDAREASEESRNLRMQLANALSLAARAAPPAPLQQGDRGKIFPDSLDVSGSDRTQLRYWIAQLRMVIRHTPSRFPDEQAKMRYAFNRLSWLAFKQILPHIREDGEIGLGALPALYNSWKQLLGIPTEWLPRKET
jgi:hypothetical protein